MITLHTWFFYGVVGAGVFLTLQNYWQRELIRRDRLTIKYQRTWIEALQKMVRKTTRERDHVVKGMTAFFPTPADNPEGWDA